MIPERVLIVNLGGIGDMLLSTPALKAIKALYPKALISALSGERGNEVIKNMPYIDEPFIFYVHHGGKVPFSKLFHNIRTLFILRKRRFDIAVNMRTIASKSGALKIKLLFDIIRPRVKVGADTDGLGYFFDIKVPDSRLDEKSEIEHGIDIAQALGAKAADRKVDFAIDDKSRAKVGEILKKEGVRDEDVLVGVHPGGMPSHRWPIDKFSALVRTIREKTDCRLVVTGTPDELPLAKKLSGAGGAKAVNVAGALNIRQLGALMERCSLFISNDTGPMHIAAILNVPLLAIFGGGYVGRFDPRKISDRAIVFYKGADCAPCDKGACDSMKCLERISVEEVTAAALEMLKRTGQP